MLAQFFMNIKSIQLTWLNHLFKNVDRTHHPHPIRKSGQSRDISCVKQNLKSKEIGNM